MGNSQGKPVVLTDEGTYLVPRRRNVFIMIFGMVLISRFSQSQPFSASESGRQRSLR